MHGEYFCDDRSEKTKGKNNYDHVESKVKLYRKNIRMQHLLNTQANKVNDILNISQPESTTDPVVADLQLQLDVVNQNYTKALNDNVAKDMKIEYFRSKLAQINAQLKTYIYDDSIQSDVFYPKQPCSPEYADASEADLERTDVDPAPVVKSKLKRFRSASERVIRKIFTCNSTPPEKCELKNNDYKMIVRSVHTPQTPKIRKVTLNQSLNDSVPIIIINTPGRKLLPRRQSDCSDISIHEQRRKSVVRFLSPKVNNVSFDTPADSEMHKVHNAEEIFNEPTIEQVVADLTLKLHVLNDDYSRVLIDNVTKDMKIEFLRLELSRLESQLKTYICDESLQSEGFYSRQLSSPESVDTSEPNDLTEQSINMGSRRSKFKGFRKAYRDFAGRIFSCNDNSLELELRDMKEKDYRMISRSVHTPRNPVVRKVSLKQTHDDVTNIIINTPLKKTKLFKPSDCSDIETPESRRSARKSVVRFHLRK